MKYIAFAFAALAIAGPARAEYGWCTIQKDSGYDTYVSDVIDIGNGSDAYQSVLVRQFGKSFQGYVGQFETIVREPDCSSSKRLSDAEELNRRISMNVGSVIRTNWRGGWPAPGQSEAATAASSGAHLTVKTSTAAQNVQEAVLDAQNAAAAVNAKRIADAARSQAAIQAQLAKFMTDLKRRGRAQ